MQEKNIDYYEGLNDGIYCCNASLTVLLKAIGEEKSANNIKLMVVQCANSIVDIMEETSKNIERKIKEKE